MKEKLKFWGIRLAIVAMAAFAMAPKRYGPGTP